MRVGSGAARGGDGEDVLRRGRDSPPSEREPAVAAARFGPALLQTEGGSGAAGDAAAADASSHRAYVLPVVLSALVPGTGEMVSGHFWRGLPLLAIDVATWAGYFHYQNEGKDWRTQYESFADQHWHYDLWQEHLANYYNEPGSPYDFYDPTLPYNCTCPYIPKEDDRQHYYENIGKYLFYWPGWEDWEYSGDPATSDSRALRDEYNGMRIESNDNFDRATDLVVVAMATRLISVIQTVFLVRGDQKQAQLDVQPVATPGHGGGLRLRYRY
jgi:hypothetical protein